MGNRNSSDDILLGNLVEREIKFSLRKFPRELKARIKAEAARREITLGEFARLAFERELKEAKNGK